MGEQEPLRTFFVYGTLKRGECREHAWPCPPESVAEATTHGQLHDLGEYPAMVPGEDLVVGELWTVPKSGLADTLRVLDSIEGYRPGNDDNLYERRIVECLNNESQTQMAYTYFYLHPLPDTDRMHPKAGEETVGWTAQ